MTLSKLIKLLKLLEAEGHGKEKVVVNKDTLDDGNNTFQLCNIEKVESTWGRLVDGDGFTEMTKSGRDRGFYCVVLKGRWSDQ